MRNKTQSYKWVKSWTSVYLVVMFMIFPLYFQNNYINILEAKTGFFVNATCIYLVGGVVWMMLERLSSIGDVKSSKQVKLQRTFSLSRFELQDSFFFVFVLAVVIATLLSGDIQNAWVAADCKLFGAKIILLCCGIYYITSKGYVINLPVKAAFSAGIMAVFVLTVLNRYGIDPLNMYSNLAEHQKDTYLSTIGNINILSNFICIFVPLIIGAYLYSDSKPGKAVCGIMTYTGVMAGIATNSDSFFLGLGAAMLLLLWFAFDSEKMLFSFCSVALIITGAVYSLRLFDRTGNYEFEWYGLQQSFIYEIPWMIFVLLLVAVMVLLYRKQGGLPLAKIRNVMFALMGAGLIAAIVLIIAVNTGAISAQSSYLIFDDDWGTNRGFVWTRTCQLFGELPFYQQMIGIGPGGFREFFTEFNLERAAAGLPAFSDPHSEFLYFLVAAGFVGVVGYFGMIVTCLIKCIKHRDGRLIMLSALLISWLAQGMVNNPLVFVTPYLFLFMGMIRYEMTKE